MLVANVSEVERAPVGSVPPSDEHEATVIRHLRDVHDALGERPALELWHEAQHFQSEGQQLYALGQIDLAARARIDDLFYAIAHGVRQRLNYEEKSHRPVLDELDAFNDARNPEWQEAMWGAEDQPLGDSYDWQQAGCHGASVHATGMDDAH